MAARLGLPSSSLPAQIPVSLNPHTRSGGLYQLKLNSKPGVIVSAADPKNTTITSGGGGGGGGSVNHNKGSRSSTTSNYVVPLDKPSCITRPLAEILRDLNKRIPDNLIQDGDPTFIPWYHANRMLSFYAPGWCGEIRDIIFSDNSTVTVVYRVTVRGSDGEAHRESTGTVSSSSKDIVDPVAAAEEIAFCKDDVAYTVRCKGFQLQLAGTFQEKRQKCLRLIAIPIS
ncbi:OLC1v1028800C1 [Oldenlandia corymbosa var. corymbosa]|uniref:OLC1v1028800C1 n=1 Tax=Oldenlandia corymbosa var. corymbosa TaxID=529605 RepID=A0AAV1CCJ9_OLDCO|nr:OLC1v1028800C1 [Oldenlandia corymbosa var. corymbosa]